MPLAKQLKGLSIAYVIFGLLALVSIPAVPLQEAMLVKMFEDKGVLDEEGLKLVQDVAETVTVLSYVMIGVHLLVNLAVAYGLVKRKFYWACFIAGILTCVAFPIGTVLGVITIVVLSKKETKQLFGLRP